jgi:hypothetical protein
MEDQWTPQIISLLGIKRDELPMIWDADFMLGPAGPGDPDTYVLGEMNVSSVFPLPEETPTRLPPGSRLASVRSVEWCGTQRAATSSFGPSRTMRF